MHYYKRNIGDYAKKAGRLSILQHGVYNLLIDACYDREKFPTREEAMDWIWVSTPEEEIALDFVLRKFFDLENGVYIQKRIAEEIEEYQEFCRIQEAKGKLGGRPKKKPGGLNEKPGGLKDKADGCPPESQRGPEKTLTTNHYPLTTNQEPLKTKPPKNKFSDDDMKTAEYFLASIRKVQPDIKQPNLEKWADCVRLMREQDNRTLSEICRVWAWARADTFWQANILSAQKFREKYDQLKAKMGAPNATGTAQPKSAIERFMQEHYSDPGQNDSGPLGRDDRVVWEQVDEPIRGEAGPGWPMAANFK